ncbi:hypothetical protein EVAR_2341_1 [Eumeta japonica]|uniref:Uncharacterized protein n=1 Tax=Eumeta variegata TaxID=151549 RepID=A0A4C1SIW4_EUMVA|nr:hypothetical protein EVAR_2341_1 [Eumeta japonica]
MHQIPSAIGETHLPRSFFIRTKRLKPKPPSLAQHGSEAAEDDDREDPYSSRTNRPGPPVMDHDHSTRQRANRTAMDLPHDPYLKTFSSNIEEPPRTWTASSPPHSIQLSSFRKLITGHLTARKNRVILFDSNPIARPYENGVLPAPVPADERDRNRSQLADGEMPEYKISDRVFFLTFRVAAPRAVCGVVIRPLPVDFGQNWALQISAVTDFVSNGSHIFREKCLQFFFPDDGSLSQLGR